MAHWDFRRPRIANGTRIVRRLAYLCPPAASQHVSNEGFCRSEIRVGREQLIEVGAAERLGDSRLKVLVVGAVQDHAYEAALRERHESRLLRLGPQPHDSMPVFLAAADVVVLPQRSTRVAQAQVPGKVFEAMAMACPIVATEVSDLPEILEGCGHVPCYTHPELFAEVIRDFLTPPGEKSLTTEAQRHREDQDREKN